MVVQVEPTELLVQQDLAVLKAIQELQAQQVHKDQ
jgi:hypothetical protein